MVSELSLSSDSNVTPSPALTRVVTSARVGTPDAMAASVSPSAARRSVRTNVIDPPAAGRAAAPEAIGSASQYHDATVTNQRRACRREASPNRHGGFKESSQGSGLFPGERRAVVSAVPRRLLGGGCMTKRGALCLLAVTTLAVGGAWAAPCPNPCVTPQVNVVYFGATAVNNSINDAALSLYGDPLRTCTAAVKVYQCARDLDGNPGNGAETCVRAYVAENQGSC